MGSTGSGRYGTYQVGNGQTANGNGGSAGEIECPSVIENIRLEDVATLDYYINNHSLPSADNKIELNNTVYKGRLVVKDISTNEILGNLPTQYNFLINCIKKGMQYTGTVVLSGTTPVPFVIVKLMPEQVVLIIGEVFIDTHLDIIDVNGPLVRLGGIFHSARAFASLNLNYALAYYAPAYLDPDINEWSLYLNTKGCYKLGNINGAPNVMLINESKEAGERGITI